MTTAQIVAPAHRSDDPAQLAAYCLAGVDPLLAEQVAAGDVLLAGTDFGAGDDQEIAVLALQSLGIAAVIAASVAPTFAEAAAAFGLPVIVAPNAARQLLPQTAVRIDLAQGILMERSSGQRFTFAPATAESLAVVRRAQILTAMRRVVEEEGFDG